MNKYGGINDLHGCDSKVYRLWYSMLRRCYDKEQHARMRGKSYEDCEVCDRWKSLSNFADDIAELDGYGEWLAGSGYCLDKDTLKQGNKIYSKENCRFIPMAENIGDIHKRHPQNVEVLHEKRKSRYRLTKGDEDFYYLSFVCPSCDEAVIGQPYRPNHCKHCGQALDWGE